MSASSAFSKLLAGLNTTLADPSSAGATGFAQGLLQASAPHLLTPISGAQALGMGLAGSQQYQQEALKNAMLRETVPFQGMKVATFANAFRTMNDPKATPQQRAQASALAAQLIAPGMGPAMLANSPQVQGAKTQAIQNATPHPVGPGQRLVTGAGAPIVGAQGALPTATTQNPNGSITALPGALQAIAATAGAGSEGSAAGSFPYQQALKLSGIVQGPQSNRVLSLAPQPGIPGTPGAPQLGRLNLNMFPGATPNPQAIAAAQAATRQRQMGTLQGVRAAGGQLPGAPPVAAPSAAPAAQPFPAAPQGRPPAAPSPQAPAIAPGVRVLAPGMSPSEITGQKSNQEQATTALNADIAATKDRQQRVANLEELNAVASGLKTGPGMDAHIAVLKALESVPGAVGLSAGKLQTITNAQIFNKTALNLSLQTVSSAGQHAYDAFKSVMNAFPELSKTPLANAVVTGSLLATARYEADKSKFAANWQQSNGMGYVQGKGSYDAAWAKNASFMTYFLNALPPAARAELWQKARTNATLRNEINQAAKSDAWLKSNGY